MYGLDLVCSRLLRVVSKSLPDNFNCSDNFPPYVIEILMKYSLFFLRVFAQNLRNIKCLPWAGACEIICNFIFQNYFDTGTISVKEGSLNVTISVFSTKQNLPIS